MATEPQQPVPVVDLEIAQRVAGAARSGGRAEREPTLEQLLGAFGEAEPTPEARTQTRLMVGPWTHGVFESTLGDLDFGIGSSGTFLDYAGDLTDSHLRWFDATLKGEEGALEGTPPVKLFVMGENRWRGYEEWPPPGSHE